MLSTSAKLSFPPPSWSGSVWWRMYSFEITHTHTPPLSLSAPFFFSLHSKTLIFDYCFFFVLFQLLEWYYCVRCCCEILPAASKIRSVNQSYYRISLIWVFDSSFMLIVPHFWWFVTTFMPCSPFYLFNYSWLLDLMFVRWLFSAAILCSDSCLWFLCCYYLVEFRN